MIQLPLDRWDSVFSGKSYNAFDVVLSPFNSWYYAA